MKKLMIGLVLVLAAATSHASEYRGTVQSMTPTSLNLIVGTGEALRLITIQLTPTTTRPANLQPGDIALVSGHCCFGLSRAAMPTEMIADTVKKCETDEYGLVKDCH